MAAETRHCPACGAPLELASEDPESIRCGFCGWSSTAADFPTIDPDHQSRFNAETLPLPKEQAAALGLSADSPSTEEGIAGSVAEDEPPAAGPTVEPRPERPADPTAHFRQLTRQSQPPGDTGELLEQVPEELRGVLAARLHATDEDAKPTLRQDTVDSLKARGYHVTEDARGARLSGGSSRSSDLSPFETVRMAAEQEGGVQPRGDLPICPECQAASPAGSKRCQWCGADLPQT